MIRKLHCRNFRSWREPEPISLAPLTVFFGANGAGKSALLQGLLLLKQSAETAAPTQVLALGGDSALVDVGSFDSLCFARATDDPFEIGLEWKLPFTLYVNDPARSPGSLFHGDRLTLHTSIGWEHDGSGAGRPVVHRTVYGFAGGEIGLRRIGPGSPQLELFHTHRELELRRRKGRNRPLPAPERCYAFPAEALAAYENLGFASDLVSQLEQRLAQVHYLGASRRPLPRQVARSGAAPTGVGRYGERTLEVLRAGQEAGKTLPAGRGRARRSVVEHVGEQLRKLGLLDGLELRDSTQGGARFEAWVRYRPGALELPVADAGEGLAQVLPILTLCACAPEGSAIVLDSPETGLDPATQAGVADVLIETTRARGVQLLVTSRSQHLLRRLQRRVAEERLERKRLALYFCAHLESGSQLLPLALDRYGTLASWPEGFFDHELEELGAIARAMLERQTRLER